MRSIYSSTSAHEKVEKRRISRRDCRRILPYYSYILSIMHPRAVHRRYRKSSRGGKREKQVIDAKSEEGRKERREVIRESGFPLTFSRNFSRHVRALDSSLRSLSFSTPRRQDAPGGKGGTRTVGVGGTRRNARAAKFPWNLSPGSRTTANPAFCARDARRRELLFQRTLPFSPFPPRAREREKRETRLSLVTPLSCRYVTWVLRNIAQQPALYAISRNSSQQLAFTFYTSV